MAWGSASRFLDRHIDPDGRTTNPAVTDHPSLTLSAVEEPVLSAAEGAEGGHTYPLVLSAAQQSRRAEGGHTYPLVLSATQRSRRAEGATPTRSS